MPEIKSSSTREPVVFTATTKTREMYEAEGHRPKYSTHNGRAYYPTVVGTVNSIMANDLSDITCEWTLSSASTDLSDPQGYITPKDPRLDGWCWTVAMVHTIILPKKDDTVQDREFVMKINPSPVDTTPAHAMIAEFVARWNTIRGDDGYWPGATRRNGYENYFPELSETATGVANMA